MIGFINSHLLPSFVKNTSYTGLMGAADWYRTLVEGIAGGKVKDNQTDGYNMWDSIRLDSRPKIKKNSSPKNVIILEI